MTNHMPFNELHEIPASSPPRPNGARLASLLAEADACLFDIDGTLLNTRGAVQYRAFCRAAQTVFGLVPRMEGLRMHGSTEVTILRAVLRREGVAESQIEAGLTPLIEHMCAEVSANASDMRVELCPSVRELLDQLQGAGKLLGIVSGNVEPIGWTKLEVAGLRHYFAFGCYSNPLELRRDIFREGVREVHARLHDGASVYAFGDTPADIDAARSIGIPVIAVATGAFPHDDLVQLNPDACVRCCTELLEIA